MSPSDLPKFDGARGTASLKGPDGAVENAQEESSRVQADFKTVATETECRADVDMSATPFESHHDRAMSEEADETRQITPILDEICHLQERLLYLEDKVTRNSDKEVTNEKTSGKETVIGEQENLELRKRIRQAASSRRFVRKAERQAEETADQRESFGQGPNNVPLHSFKDILEDTTSPTMFHIGNDGAMLEGTQKHALFETPGWLLTTQGRHFRLGRHLDIRSHEKPHPHRGSRPPTALRPIYGEGNAHRSMLREDARTSRKLGPPTQWDESDSEEWSSDTSTRSRDFDYFRARLRGDFEWELDRLNAQVKRFKRHKAKKEARQRALEAEKEGVHENEEHGNAEQDYLPDKEQGSLMKDSREAARPKLNPIGWETFQNAKALPKQLACVIDVLTEEPKVGIEARSYIKRPNKFPKNYKATKAVGPGHRTIGKGKADEEVQVDPGSFSDQPGQFNCQDPLPERIRINSQSIIEVLSSIRGTPICEASCQSLVILRPFKVLSAYEKEIGELSSQLAIEIDRILKDQLSSENLDATTQEASFTSTSADNKPIEKSPNTGVIDKPASDGTDVVKVKDLMVKKEHLRCLQEFMDFYINRKAAYLNGLDCSKISFLDLWYLFRPGLAVITADGKQAYQVISVRSKRHKGTDQRLPWAIFKYTDSEDSDSSTSSDGRIEHHDITIKCAYIHFDGRNFGPVIRSFGMNKWDGVKDIALLEILPLRLHVVNGLREMALTSSNSMEITEENLDRATQKLQRDLKNRGSKFVQAAAVKHMYYSGLAVDTRDEIESQVVIDFEAAFSDEARQHWMPDIRRLLGTDWNSENKSSKQCTAECCRGEDVLDDSYIDTNNSQNFVNNLMSKIEHTSHKLPSAVIFPRPFDESRSQGETFNEDELMIMSYSVFGFVLRDRTWAELDLEYLTDVRAVKSDKGGENTVESDQGAFAQLVLPPGHKKMVLSLISQHFRNKGSSDASEDSEQLDIVRGKGKGLIILLHGAPGVGKTTTAEGVAETFGKPLFQITCGDLGSTPKEVESALQTNFALANRWGCILLLDEADVFLAERRREDFNRNGMVAVFLRVLEYYAGILFLTTNRIGDFDEAFASRIHMSLHYPALDEVSTMKVFKLNLGMIKNRLKDRIEIDDMDIINFAMKHWRKHEDARWNGRQIRNACQTALALAENDAQPKGQEYDIKRKSNAKVHLTLEHLKVVSDSYLDFTNYLKAVHGAGAEGRAKESGLRALGTLLEALKSGKGKHNEDSSKHPEKDQKKAAANNSPLQSFTLRPSSTVPHPNTAARPTPDTRPAQPTPQSSWAPPQWPYESPAFQAQRMQHEQQQYYTGNQPTRFPQPETLTTQPGSAGHHPHTPQPYGNPMFGQYQPPPMQQQTQGSQSYGPSYPNTMPPAGHVGPSAQGAGPGPHAAVDQGGQDQ